MTFELTADTRYSWAHEAPYEAAHDVACDIGVAVRTTGAVYPDFYFMNVPLDELHNLNRLYFIVMTDVGVRYASVPWLPQEGGHYYLANAVHIRAAYKHRNYPLNAKRKDQTNVLTAWLAWPLRREDKFNLWTGDKDGKLIWKGMR